MWLVGLYEKESSTGYFRYVTLKSEIHSEGALLQYGWAMG